MTTRAERDALAKALIDTFKLQMARKQQEWDILGWDENHPQVIEETYILYSKTQDQLKKIEDANERESHPPNWSFIERF